MEIKARNFFLKNHFTCHDVVCLTRQDQKTLVHLQDGSILYTYLPIKTLLTAIPEELYLCINKGIVVLKKHVAKVEGKIYTMQDGTVFVGRARELGRHHYNQFTIANIIADEDPFKQFAVLDQQPLPFMVLESLSDSKGHIHRFILRYGNKALGKILHISLEKHLGKPFGKFLHNGRFNSLEPLIQLIQKQQPEVITLYSHALQSKYAYFAYPYNNNCCAGTLVKLPFELP